MNIKIRNCNFFTYECTLESAALRLTERDDVRFCAVCEQEVYFCDTAEKPHEAITLGRCVAVPEEDRPPRMGGVCC